MDAHSEHLDNQKFGTTDYVHETWGSLRLTNDSERMSQKSSAFEPAIRRLERQAAASIDEDTDLLAVVRECDVSTAEVYEAGETKWNACYGYESMVRAFYCKELAGVTTEELHKYLADAECACTLGFDPDQFADEKTAPSRTTLGRAWRERFPDQLKTFLQTSAERILGVVHEMGTPLGLRALDPEDKSDVSSRSEQRYIDSKAKKITQALCEYVFLAMGLDLLAAEESVQPITYAIDTHEGTIDAPATDRVAVLTGANSGGKTTLLETLCQVALLAHMRLLVPAEAATVSLTDTLVLHQRHASFNELTRRENTDVTATDPGR